MFYPILLLLQLLLPVKSGFTHLWTIPVKGDKVASDNLGNPMVIDKDVLNKYRDNGTFFRTFSNKRLGKISAIDAMNPLKIAVFYRDFFKVQPIKSDFAIKYLVFPKFCFCQFYTCLS